MIKNWLNKIKQNVGHQKALIALGLTVLMFIISLFTTMHWETNDDIGIATVLMQGKNAMAPFVNPFLGQILVKVFSMSCAVNWWTVVTLVAVFSALWATYYIVLKRFSFVESIVFLTIISSIWYVYSLNVFNFTRTATVAAFAGVMLLLDAGCDHRSGKKFWWQIILGVVLICLGLMIRNDIIIMISPYAGLCIITLLIHAKPKFSKEWIKSKKRLLISFAFLIGTFAAVFLSQKVYLETHQEYAQYVEFNGYRSAVQDYSISFPSWEDGWRDYQKIGITKQQLNLIFTWNSEEPDNVNIQIFQKLLTLKDKYPPKFGLQDFVCRTSEHKIIIIVFFLAITLCVLDFKENWLEVLLSCFGTLCCLGYIYYMGRYVSRVVDGFLLLCILTMIYLAYGKSKAIKEKGKELIFIFMLCGICFTVTTGVLSNSWGIFEKPIKGKQEALAKLEYVQNLKKTGKVFVTDCFSGVSPTDYGIVSFWTPFDARRWNNIFYTGGWGSGSPYVEDKLKNQGMPNMIKALVEKENVVASYSKPIFEYLVSAYEPNLSVCSIRYMNNTSMVQYGKPIYKMEPYKAGYQIKLRFRQVEDSNSLHVWGNINNSQEVEYLYLNIQEKNGDYVRSYRLDYNRLNGHLKGVCWDAYRKYKDKKNFETFLVAKINGRYVRI